MAFKILVVEDEKEIREIVGKYLQNEGYEVFLGKDGIEGLALFHDCQPHLMILDVMMPGISGFDVLKEVRVVSEIPIIMLTAKHEEVDRLNGFNLGVDDYVVKPFSPKELVKRVQVMLKRSYNQMIEKEVLIVGNLLLDIKRQKLFINHQEIEITAKEFLLLNTFFNNVGILLTRDQLIEKAFGFDYDGFDRNVDSYIKKLRQKIEKDSRNPEYLKTKYGAGYIFGGGSNDN